MKGIITSTGRVDDDAARQKQERNKEVIFKNYALTDFIRKIVNTKVDNAKDLDVVMPMYNLIEHSDN